MKFIFFTDSHFHLFTDFSTPNSEYYNDRFKEQIESLQKVFDIAREEKSDVIFGGDLFHKRNSVDTRVYNKVFEVFARNRDIDVYMLRGNHDSVTNSLYTSSSIEPIGYLPNIHIFSSTDTFSFTDVNLVFEPYGDETEEIKEHIKRSYDENKTNILVAHLGVEGSLTGKGSHRLEGAFGYQDLLPDKFDFILLGHYHRRQYFQNPNHFYGGSLLQQSFSDEQDSNGVHLIDTEKITTEFIPLDTRRFITVKGDNLPSNLQELQENGHFIRFIGTPEQAKTIQMDSGEFETNLRVEVKRDYNVEKRIEGSAQDSPKEISQNFAKQYYPDSEKEIVECIEEVL